jgi:hypothetical protein
MCRCVRVRVRVRVRWCVRVRVRLTKRDGRQSRRVCRRWCSDTGSWTCGRASRPRPTSRSRSASAPPPASRPTHATSDPRSWLAPTPPKCSPFAPRYVYRARVVSCRVVCAVRVVCSPARVRQLEAPPPESHAIPSLGHEAGGGHRHGGDEGVSSMAPFSPPPFSPTNLPSMGPRSPTTLTAAAGGPDGGPARLFAYYLPLFPPADSYYGAHTPTARATRPHTHHTTAHATRHTTRAHCGLTRSRARAGPLVNLDGLVALLRQTNIPPSALVVRFSLPPLFLLSQNVWYVTLVRCVRSNSRPQVAGTEEPGSARRRRITTTRHPRTWAAAAEAVEAVADLLPRTRRRRGTSFGSARPPSSPASSECLGSHHNHFGSYEETKMPQRRRSAT